ncbi:MAG: rhomboid family intramembrane serine protease [Parachlamydiaceae bacterium]|nr:rhomboid family intramembrane serine protease [Parachlamydiaceae bacterium]
MMPLGDDNSLRKSIPIVTYVLIFMNIIFFLLELAGGETFIKEWAFVPSRFLANPIANIPTIFTSMFMHAGWAHLIGNMLYLWIFGDNVEDYFGKIKYLIFYLLCGIAATFSQFIFSSGSSVPNLGASGAIAGVLGAYILLLPQGKVNVLLGSSVTQMPALIVIGFWFLLQFFSGVGSIASTDQSGEGGGVAYMAHIGGFLAGLAMAVVFKVFDKPKQ